MNKKGVTIMVGSLEVFERRMRRVAADDGSFLSTLQGLSVREDKEIPTDKGTLIRNKKIIKIFDL